MENRVRDLDQIQEREPSESGQRLTGVIIGTLAVVALTFAIGVMVGETDETGAESEDPLALLQRGKAKAQAAVAKDPKVDAADLTFPEALSGQEERPEVLAALEAAALEEAALENPATPLDAVGDEHGQAIEAAPKAEPEPEPEPVNEEHVAAVMPAAVAAGATGRELPAAAKRDKLVAAAIPVAPAAADMAPRGTEGDFNLQIISYDNPDQARTFAEGLRTRGHQSFVMQADIPERGRFWRVRIGPFKSRFKADKYRQQFEAQEGMNTFVVRRPKDA